MPFVTPLVRAARADDYGVFARLFPELRVEDPVPTPEAFAARMVPWTVVLEAEAGGDAVGYGFWQAYGPTAHVVQVVVDAGVRGRGLGIALMGALAERARERGCARWYLNVKQDNKPAIRLYERCGLRIEQPGWALRTAWSELAALPGADVAADALEAFTPAAEDDAGVAAALRLDAHRIGVLRARPGVLLRALRERGVPVAFAAFDPAFPGVYPLGVARAPLARPLLELLRPHAREDRLLVTVEGDASLRAALEGAGARVLHRFFRMSAPLPDDRAEP